MRVDETSLSQSADHHLAIDGTHFALLLERDDAKLIELDAAGILGHDRCVGSGITGHTTSVECTECQLRTRLTDGLCGDDTDGFTLLYHALGGQVAAIALHADTLLALASQHRTNFDALDGRVFNSLGDGFCNLLTSGHDELSSGRIDNIMYRHTSQDALIQSGNSLVAILQGRALQSAKCAAVFLSDNHIMRHINQTTCQITGIGRLHGGVGQTLTGTVGGDEVLQHRHSFLEVREDGVFNRTASFSTGFLRLGHQTAHTSQLLDLVLRTTGARIEHHIDGVESLVGLGHLLQQHLAQLVVHMRPSVDNLIVTLVVGDEAHVIVVSDGLDFVVSLLDKFLLLLRNDDVIEVERKTGLVSHAITQVLDTIEELASFCETYVIDNLGDDVTE